MPSDADHLNSLLRFDVIAVVLESRSHRAAVVAVDLSYENRASGEAHAVPTLVLHIEQAKALARALSAAVDAANGGKAMDMPFG